jgi:hypothetical protein
VNAVDAQAVGGDAVPRTPDNVRMKRGEDSVRESLRCPRHWTCTHFLGVVEALEVIV